MSGDKTLMAFHIITVTQGGVLYRDRERIVRWIDFARCHQNWQAYRADAPTDRRYVGWRNTGNVLDIEFFTEPRTRFVFISYVQRDTTLLKPMQWYDWYTFDVSRSNN